MKLPILSNFSFTAKRATQADKDGIVAWLGNKSYIGATIAVADDGDDTGTITIQLVDAAGVAVESAELIDVLIGGAARTASDIGAAGTFVPATILTTVTADANYRAFTAADGSLVIPFTPTAVPDDVHVTVIVNGRTFSGVGTIADAA